MGVMPVGKLLVNMALPMIISMLVQALYNIVDSVYVSQVSESAVTALSLAFPVQNMQIGFAVFSCSTGAFILLSILVFYSPQYDSHVRSIIGEVPFFCKENSYPCCIFVIY